MEGDTPLNLAIRFDTYTDDIINMKKKMTNTYAYIKMKKDKTFKWGNNTVKSISKNLKTSERTNS